MARLAGMPQTKRRFKKGRIDFLTLCHRGANNQPVVYKADGLTPRVVLKATEDKGEVTALVYVPEVRDNQGDIASAEVIKNMAYGFAEAGHQIDILHNEIAVAPERAFVAENFIVQKGDPRFAGWKDYNGNPIDPTGAWGVVVKVNDPALRALYKDGKWNGVSMGGTGDFVDETKVGKAQEKDDMNEEQVTALVKKILSEMAPKSEEPKAKAPVFKGDISRATPKQLREHAAAVKKAQRFADVDMNDPESLEAVAAEIEAEEKVAKAAKTSALPPVNADEGEGDVETEVSKAEAGKIEVDADADVPEDDLVWSQVGKFMTSRLPEARRATATK